MSSQLIEQDPALAELQVGVEDVIRATREAIQSDGTDAYVLASRRTELSDAAGRLTRALGRRKPIDSRDAGSLCSLLIEVTELLQDLDEQRARIRLEAVARIYTSMSRLRSLRSLPELLDAAPQEICDSCDFDRALVSRVRGSTWVPDSLHIAAGQDDDVTEAVTDFLKGTEIQLTPNLLETELVRRRAPALITDPSNDARTYKDLMAVSQTRAYVAAPVMPRGRVIGLLHADSFGSGRELTTQDRDNLWTFAEGFGLIFERMVLVERLTEQRNRIREAFRRAEASIEELGDTEVRLAREDREETTLVRSAASVLGSKESRLQSLLTPREREVLALMASGGTNSEIADQLVISEGTVKSHVKHVLRKLRASNRAEAVSRYLHLAMKERA